MSEEMKTEAETKTPPATKLQPGIIVKQQPPLPDEWRKATTGGLAELCRKAGLPVKGNREEMLKRIDVAYHGSSDRHVNALVKCPYCGAAANVKGTSRPSETVRRRFYNCTGRRKHSFTIDEKV